MLSLERRIRRARRDPNAFLEFCFAAGSGVRQAPVHRQLQRFLSRSPRALVELPRDHGKSTQIAARLVWELGHRPGLRIVLVCAAEHLAVARSRFLRDAITSNPRVGLVFPHLRPQRPWAADAFAVERCESVLGPSVTAFGLGAASTGARADLLVCDDLVDVKAVYSAAERERVCEEFFNNVLNLLEPDGRCWCLSTPWHADDLNARLKRNGGFALFRKPIGPNLEPVWPARWPRRALKRRRDEIGSAAFARGYHLTPIAPDELLIRPEWVQTWSEPPPRFDRVILSVDPAISGKATADASALVVLGHYERTVYCLAAVSRRVPAPVLLEWIDHLDEQWQPEAIVFESNGAFEAVKDLLVRHARYGGKVLGVKQTKSKASRFAAFAVPVQTGAFRVAADGSQRELIGEMTTAPFGEHDDLLDAAATGTMHLLGQRREPRIWDGASLL